MKTIIKNTKKMKIKDILKKYLKSLILFLLLSKTAKKTNNAEIVKKK